MRDRLYGLLRKAGWPLVMVFLMLCFFNIFNPLPLVSDLGIGGIGGTAEPSPGQQRVLDNAGNSEAGTALAQAGYTQKSLVQDPELLMWLKGESGAANAAANTYVVFSPQGQAMNADLKDATGNQVAPSVIVDNKGLKVALTQKFKDKRGLTCFYPEDPAVLQPAWVQLNALVKDKSLNQPYRFTQSEVPEIPSGQLDCYIAGAGS